MRVMVMIEGSGADEDKIAPTQEMLEQMDAYNEELVKAGIMLDGQGLKPSSAGARVVFEGGSTSVVDGPFTESKEIVAGYWLWEVGSLERRSSGPSAAPPTRSTAARQVLEVRPLFELEDFAETVDAETLARSEELQGSSQPAAPDGPAADHRGDLAHRVGPPRSPRWSDWSATSALAEDLPPGGVRRGHGALADRRPAAESRRLAADHGPAQGDRPDPARETLPRREVRAAGQRAAHRAGRRRRLTDTVDDDLLALMFTACHPVLPRESRVALTLRLLGGLTTDEIARAFLVPSATIGSGSPGRSAPWPRHTSGTRCPTPMSWTAAPVGARSDLPDLHRGVRGDLRDGLGPT